jgi:hypothetical protein
VNSVQVNNSDLFDLFSSLPELAFSRGLLRSGAVATAFASAEYPTLRQPDAAYIRNALVFSDLQ